LAEVQQRIEAALARSGRPARSVALVAVAKTADATTLQEAWQAGQRCFGHNRVQALATHRLILPQATWHLLGPLQGRRVRSALEIADLFEAIGDQQVVARLQRRLEENGATTAVPIYVQVNLEPEDGRYGVPLPELSTFLESLQAAPLLQPCGLMTIAPFGAEGAHSRQLFRSLRTRFEELTAQELLPADAQLSMGMSGDYETAVEEGATLVRVGRAIFPVAATEDR